MSAKQWIATLNNPTEEETNQAVNLQGVELVVDRELGEAQTPHLHIFLHLANRARLSALKKILPRAHWEVAESRDMAVNYCSKGEVLVRKLLVKPTKRRLGDAIETLRNEGMAGVAREHPEVYVLHAKGLQALRCSWLDQTAKQPPQVSWYWGATGTGKSRKAIGDEVNQDNIYIQRGPQSKGSPMWWDGYCGQKRVVLDDFRPWWCPFSLLLGLLDRYPIQVPVKGGFMNFVPEEIIITTPRSIQDTFSEFRAQEDIDQVSRRVHKQVQFLSLDHSR